MKYLCLVFFGVFAMAYISEECSAAGAQLHTYRCALDVPQFRAQYDLFVASGETEAEGRTNVIQLCESSVPAEEAYLCRKYAANRESTNLVCQRGLTVPF